VVFNYQFLAMPWPGDFGNLLIPHPLWHSTPFHPTYTPCHPTLPQACPGPCASPRHKFPITRWRAMSAITRSRALPSYTHPRLAWSRAT
jgi:hypothetical protein